MKLSGNMAKKCGHCNKKTSLPYEYEWSCISRGCKIMKTKHELSKSQRKKNKFH